MECEHEDFVANVEVQRIDNGDGRGMVGLWVDVRCECDACHEPLVFRGLPVGLTQEKPTISVDGTELRIPARMQSHDPHFGLGLPGFAARVREGYQGTEN